MPRGASPKREREYQEIEKKFEKEGRYKGREKEVAARIVNKQRAEHGETKAQKASGKSKSSKTKASAKTSTSKSSKGTSSKSSSSKSKSSRSRSKK
jgi:hypothetical protein